MPAHASMLALTNEREGHSMAEDVDLPRIVYDPTVRRLWLLGF
jgi:hypothetical protein